LWSREVAGSSPGAHPSDRDRRRAAAARARRARVAAGVLTR
jgi:hypothetical protein